MYRLLLKLNCHVCECMLSCFLLSAYVLQRIVQTVTEFYKCNAACDISFMVDRFQKAFPRFVNKSKTRNLSNLSMQVQKTKAFCILKKRLTKAQLRKPLRNHKICCHCRIVMLLRALLTKIQKQSSNEEKKS